MAPKENYSQSQEDTYSFKGAVSIKKTQATADLDVKGEIKAENIEVTNTLKAARLDVSIDTANLKDNAVTGAKIKDGAITLDKLHPSISLSRGDSQNSPITINQEIPNNSITAEKIQNATITPEKLHPSVSLSEIKLADASITGDKIKDKTITKDKLAFSPESGDSQWESDKNGIYYRKEGKAVGINKEPGDEKLEVNGNIKLGLGAILYAPGARENLMILRGSYPREFEATQESQRSIDYGSDFDVENTEPEKYKIIFRTPFTKPPTVFVTQHHDIGTKLFNNPLHIEATAEGVIITFIEIKLSDIFGTQIYSGEDKTLTPRSRKRFEFIVVGSRE